MIKKEIGKLFPNLNSTIAYYSPTSFCITLNTVSEEEYKNVFREKMSEKSANVLSILIHEMRHHLDHISTLWGQKHIKQLAEAINARLLQDEKEFWKIVALKAEERQREFAIYYTEHYNRVIWKKGQGNWTYRFSTGIRFNEQGEPDSSKPIMFIVFSTADKVPLVRVPLSVSSLLETNSTKDEREVLGGYVNSLPDDERLVEGVLFTTRTFEEILYNQNLALYNAAVHLTANILELTEVTQAFKISSAVATLTLNLPDSILNQIPLLEEDINVWGDRPKSLLGNFEYGYIFYTLLKNYKARFKDKPEFDLSILLETNHLPPEDELEKLILADMKTIHKGFDELKNIKNNMKNVCKRGAEFFIHRGVDGTRCSISELISEHGFKPSIICNDTMFPSSYEDLGEVFKMLPIDDLNPAQWYNFSLIMDRKMDEFFEIRGI